MAQQSLGSRASVAAVSLAALVLAGAAPAAARAPATPIRHVVVIYQENHSWDETMGQFCAAHPKRHCAGPTIGSQVTFKDGTTATIATEPDIVPTVAHQTDSQEMAAGNRWDQIPGCKTANGYACATGVPATAAANLYVAASSGAIATRAFEAFDHASWAAHFELVSADADGFLGFNPSPAPGHKGAYGGCRSAVLTKWLDPVSGLKSLQPACIPDYHVSPANFPPGWPADAGGAFQPTPVPHISNLWEDRLNPAHLSWKEYINGPKTNNTIWNICTTFASCVFSDDANKMVPSSQLTIDASDRALPAVSFVIPDGPDGSTSQHNGTSFVKGDNQIGSYLSALSHGPLWRSTAVFLLYDDCGCFYDHVTPPPGMGPRVPFVLTSPWAAHRTTYRRTISTASLLAFIEYNWHLAPLAKLDAHADRLLGMFDFHQRPAVKPLRTVQRAAPASSMRYLRAHPPADDDNT